MKGEISRNIKYDYDWEYIYYLADPRNGEVKYVGRTVNLKSRLKNHLNKAKNKGTRRVNWITSLRSEGVKPSLIVVDKVPLGEGRFWEKFWISQFLVWGFDLLNYLGGKDGLSLVNETTFVEGHHGDKVVGVNKEGKVVYRFDNCTIASSVVGLHPSSINNCVNGVEKTSAGLVWYREEYFNKMSLEERDKDLTRRFTSEVKANKGSFKKGHGSKAVIVKDLEKGIEKRFNSIKEASEYLGGVYSTVAGCVNRGQVFNKRFKIDKI